MATTGKERRSPDQDDVRSSPTPGPPSPQNNGTAALSSTESLSPPLPDGSRAAPALQRLRRFLTALQQFAADVGADTGERVRQLIHNLVVLGIAFISDALRTKPLVKTGINLYLPVFSKPVASPGLLHRLRRFLTALQQFAADVGADTGERVRQLIHNLVSGTLNIEEFQAGVQECTNYPLRASVPGFLRALLPLVQRDLHARARRLKQNPLQYIRSHEHLILEVGGDSSDIFAHQPASDGSVKRRASDP
ncbi:hypothetical protein evm_001831 [Chilo suppressalis]|nr:hypothetical protein evm_001831 [Chilo suppressalis]